VSINKRDRLISTGIIDLVELSSFTIELIEHDRIRSASTASAGSVIAEPLSSS